MKRIIIPVIVLTALIVYSIYSENYLIDFCDETYLALESCGENIKKEAYAEAEATADKLLSVWEKQNVFLSVIIGDSYVSDAYGNIVAISHCLKDKLYSECLVLIRECQGNISEISEENRTGFGNVL